MRAFITTMGEDAALRLPAAVVEALRLAPGVEVDVILEGGEARVRPLRKSAGDHLEDLLAEADRIGWENQPILEDWSAVEPPWPDEPGRTRT